MRKTAWTKPFPDNPAPQMELFTIRALRVTRFMREFSGMALLGTPIQKPARC